MPAQSMVTARHLEGVGATHNLVWKGTHAPSAGVAEFGDPTRDTGYAACVYFGETLAADLQLPGGARWRPLGNDGYAYTDSAGVVRRLLLLGSDADRTSVRLIAKGVVLSGGSLPVTMQLIHDAGPLCWESVYSGPNVVKQSAATTRLRYRGVPRPNVIVINMDDLAPHMTDFMPTVLNEIAAEGVTFAGSFASNPLCSASRATLLSGNYAHKHGVLNLGGADGGAGRFVGPDRETIAVWLQRQGYRTGHFGKYINNYHQLCDAESCYVPPGWDVWRAFPVDRYYNYFLSVDGPKVAYGNGPADYSTDVLRDQALAFLDAHPQEPVFVYFAAYAPHVETPSLVPVPAPRHAGLFAGVEPWRPLSYLEADVSDKPAWVQALPGELTPLLTGFVDGVRLLALDTLLATDEAIAAILDKLAAQGRLTDTVVVFTSDNGYSYMEHRTFGKQTPYEQTIRVPLAIRYDRLLRERGAVRSDLALNIDVAPTLAEWAQVPAAALPPVDGLSLARAAAGTEALPRDAVLLEQWQPRPFAGVRTDEWKYVRHATGERELYDLANDPDELTNVAGANPALADQLEQRILDLGGSLPVP